MASYHFRDNSKSVFDEHGTDIYTRTWYYAVIANELIEHHLRNNPSATQPNPKATLSFRFFGVKLIDEELSRFVNSKLRQDTVVHHSVLSQYKRYIKPLLTAYVNATDEERKYVIVAADKGCDTDTTTTMSKFTIGTQEAVGKKPRRVFITKTVGDEPDHSDNMGAFGDQFRHIMRSNSPFTDISGFRPRTMEVTDLFPNVKTLLDHETPQTEKYVVFLHDLVLDFIHDCHASSLSKSILA
jgi:hypothetical protein